MTPSAAAAAPVVHRGRAAPGRPLAPAHRPRRVSGPVRNPPRTRPRATPRPEERLGLAGGALARLEGIASHRLLDRLIRGRVWIFLVAFALIGIVTLQLGLLKLNASIGRSLERAALLQRENSALSIENSELASGDRVESSAGRLGMGLVPAGALRFLTVHTDVDAAHAAAALRSQTHASNAAAASSAEATSPTAAAVGSSPSSTVVSEAGGESGASSVPGASTPGQATASPPSEAAAATSGSTTPSGGESSSAASTGGPAGSQPAPAAPPTSSASGGSAVPSAGGGASGEAAPAGGTQPSPAG